jgi:hypothetical protein
MASHAHIPGCARLNLFRLNMARLNYYEPLTTVIIGGADQSRNVRIEGAAVEHVLNDAPDTAAVRVHKFVPVAGQPFALYTGTGSQTVNEQLFGGRILETTVLYESRKDNVAYDLHCIDPTWLLNRQRVYGTHVGASADGIAKWVIINFTRSVTTTHVATGLPIIDRITFTNETVAACLTAICERVGAYWYLDYANDLHVFLSETPDAHPITDADPRGSSDHQLSEDLSQVVTRVIARGGGGEAFVDVAAGAAEIPVTDDSWYSDAGGVIEAGTWRATYTGVRGRSQTGALVGALTMPTSQLTTSLSSGGTMGGTHQYAQTLTSATGETLPGPITSVYAGIPAPTLFKTTMRDSGIASWPGDNMTAGGSYAWRVHVLFEGGGFAIGPPTDYYVVNSNEWEVYLGLRVQDPATRQWYNAGIMSSGPGRIIQTVLNRTVNGGAVWYSEYHWDGEAVGTANGWMRFPNQRIDSDLSQGPPYPTGPLATFNKVTVSGIEPAPAGFTGVKLYRTPVNASQLKLVATNPGATFVDTVADAALGANAPTVDTAAVPPSNGQVVAGSSVLPVTSLAPFTADGGWAEVGNIPIRYTGTSAGQLTGLPATGVGSLTATVRHGTQVLVIARLVGVAGNLSPIAAGDPIPIRLELDDAAAQAALGARLGGTAADGIVEEVFSDSRMTIVELLNYARALLADRKDPRLTLRFITRDETVQVGRLITVSMAKPPISGTFRVQRITFDEIAISGGLGRTQPRRTVEASNKLFTFADLLRRLRGREGGAG